MYQKDILFDEGTVYQKIYHLISGSIDLAFKVPGWYTLGRDDSCDYVLSDPEISRKHCRLAVGDSLSVTDLNSTNGTYVNHKRIYDKSTLLEDGDVLSIGFLEFRVSTERIPQKKANASGFIEESGLFKVFTNQTHCPKCKKMFKDENDKYCRYCGTERKKHLKLTFEQRAFEDCMTIYGPPPVTVHYQCNVCGNRWQGSNWSMDRYCPNCGNECENDLPEREFHRYG